MTEDALREEMKRFEKKIEDLLNNPERYTEHKYPWKKEITLEWFLEFFKELLDILRKMERRLDEKLPSGEETNITKLLSGSGIQAQAGAFQAAGFGNLLQFIGFLPVLYGEAGRIIERIQQHLRENLENENKRYGEKFRELSRWMRENRPSVRELWKRVLELVNKNFPEADERRRKYMAVKLMAALTWLFNLGGVDENSEERIGSIPNFEEGGQEFDARHFFSAAYLAFLLKAGFEEIPLWVRVLFGGITAFKDIPNQLIEEMVIFIANLREGDDPGSENDRRANREGAHWASRLFSCETRELDGIQFNR